MILCRSSRGSDALAGTRVELLAIFYSTAQRWYHTCILEMYDLIEVNSINYKFVSLRRIKRKEESKLHYRRSMTGAWQGIGSTLGCASHGDFHYKTLVFLYRSINPTLSWLVDQSIDWPATWRKLHSAAGMKIAARGCLGERTSKFVWSKSSERRFCLQYTRRSAVPITRIQKLQFCRISASLRNDFLFSSARKLKHRVFILKLVVAVSRDLGSAFLLSLDTRATMISKIILTFGDIWWREFGCHEKQWSIKPDVQLRQLNVFSSLQCAPHCSHFRTFHGRVLIRSLY